MFITVYEPDLKRNRIARALSNAGLMHKFLFENVFEASRKDAGVLYRIEQKRNGYLIFVKSEVRPKEVEGLKMVTQKEMTTDELPKRGRYNFFIELTPMVSVHGKKHYIMDDTDGNGQKIRGSRRQKRILWVKDQFEKRGIKLLSCTEGEAIEKFFRHSEEKGGSHGHKTAWKYSGTMEIEDAEKFAHAYTEGIGTGKAYGNGMLLLG